jgi:uncharacterized membrane protein YdjX (TVP38/TMEM64 family)
MSRSAQEPLPGAPDADASAPPGLRQALRTVRERGLGPTAVLTALWAVTPGICGFVLLAYVDTVSQWLRAHGNAGLVLYTVVFMLAGGLGLLPTYAQAVLGGWCFAFAAGFPAALAGFTGAALLGYLVAHTVARRRVVDTIEANDKARAMRNALIGHGFWKTTGLVTLLRLPPNSPFAITNMALSSTGVPIAAFALGTILGMAPRTGVAVFLGSTIETLTADTELVPRRVKIIMAAVSVVLVLLIYWIGKRTWDRVTAQQQQNGPAPGPTPAPDAPAA